MCVSPVLYANAFNHFVLLQKLVEGELLLLIEASLRNKDVMAQMIEQQLRHIPRPPLSPIHRKAVLG